MALMSGPTRRVVLIVGLSALMSIFFVFSFRNRPYSDNIDTGPLTTADVQNAHPGLVGPVIASHLSNETLKAELGQAAWKLLHTTMARFPDDPTMDESQALRSYIHLFQRLYPCGDCARHFGQILERYPPQVSSRSAAAGWACHVHNEVNKSLRKDLFDCSKIGDFYDCGCADDERAEMNRANQG